MANKKKQVAPRALSSFDELDAAGFGAGYRPAFTAIEAAAPEQPAEERGFLGAAKDTGISLLKGAIGVPESAVGLADLVTGGRAGQAAEAIGFRPREAKAMLEEAYSAPQKEAFRRVQAAEGFGDTMFAAVTNPSVVAHSVVESLPLMGAGGLIGRGVAALAPRVGGPLAGAIGEGVVGAGSAAETIRQQTADGTLDARQAALAGGTGVLTTGFGLLGGKLAKQLGFADPDTMIAAAARDAAATRSLTQRVLGGALTEGVFEELPQSVQEQVLQNMALNKPLDEGVNQAAVLGMLSGAAMGGGANLIASSGPMPNAGAQSPGQSPGQSPAPAPVQAPAQEPAPEPKGPLSRAANAMPVAASMGMQQPQEDAPQQAYSPGQPIEGTNIAALLGSGMNRDPLQGAMARQRDEQAAQQTLASWMERAAPMPLEQAQKLQSAAAEKTASEMSVVPHSSGSGFTVVPSQWITPDMRAKVPAALPNNLANQPETPNVSNTNAVEPVAPADGGQRGDVAGSGSGNPVDPGGNAERGLGGPAAAPSGASVASPTVPDANGKPVAPVAKKPTPAQSTAAAGESWTMADATARDAMLREAGWKPASPGTEKMKTQAWDKMTQGQRNRLAKVIEAGVKVDGLRAAKAAEASDSGEIGRGDIPIAEGGKPFARRSDAQAAKKNHPGKRVIRFQGGFALADKTQAQIAAQANAAKRLARGSTGNKGVPMAAHELIAGVGGLSKSAMSDLGFDRNMRVGSRWLFAANGGVTIERATEMLYQDGYIGTEDQRDAINTLSRSAKGDPQYTPDGIEAIAQAEMQARFEDYQAAQQEAAERGEADPFAEFIKSEDMVGTGYDEAGEVVQAEVRALLALLDTKGIDGEAILEEVAKTTENGTQDDYHQAAKAALTAAIEAEQASSGNRGADSGQEGAGAGEAAQGLTAPTREDILAQQDREANAQALDDKAQIDREASGFTLQSQAQDNRTDNTGDMFGGPSAEDVLAQPNTKPAPPQPTPAQIAEEARLEREKEAKKPKDTGWNMSGTGYGGKRYIGRNIITEDGREIVGRVYENAGTYEEAEVKVDGVRKFTVTDRYNAQDKADAFIKTLTEDAPSLDLKGFDRVPKGNGAFELRDGNMTVSVEPMGGNKYQASFRGAKSSPHLQGEHGAVDWADAYRAESMRAESKKEAAPFTPPEGFKPAGEPFYRGGKQIQGYAPFNIGERVTMKESAGQSGVVESLTSPDDAGVFAGALVKFDNGVEQIVSFGKLEAAKPAVQAGTPKLTPDEAKELMEWVDLGQKGGVKTHILTFYESKADKDAHRGRMTMATVSKGERSATAWTVEGDDKRFGTLGLAKKRGMEIGMAKAKTDGFVQMSALEQALGADVMSRPVDKAAKLRKDADKLAAEARKMLEGIEPGQPIMSARDRNLRERSMEKMRKAAELNAQADALDADTTAAPAQQEAQQTGEFNAQAAWDAMTPAARGAMLDKWAGAGQTDMGERYKSRAWGSFNAGEKGTLAAVLKAAQEPATDDRDTFTLKRLNRETGRMEPVTFKRGEYVEVTLIGSDKKDYGEIDGISQARREFSVNGLWHTMGAAYKAERPAAPVRKDMAPLSSVIDKMNAKNGEGLTEADRVPEQKPASKTPTVDRHEAMMKSVREGKATAEQFKAAFESLVANKDAVLAELETKTKAELLKAGGYFIQMRYASEKKGEVIDAIYRQMVSGFVLGDTLSYGMGKGAFEAAVRRHVEATDDAKLEQYAKDRQAAIAEAQAERAAKAAAMENPQTLGDFKSILAKHINEGKSAKEAFLALTPEQRIKYDTLSAESTREAREARKRERKTEVRAAAQSTGGEIIATKHTREGYDLFVVQLADRLSAEDFNTVLTSAKRMGGWYSSFRGNGAVPGFQFKDKANAEAFLKLAAGDTSAAKEQVQQRRNEFEDDRSQTAAERLGEMADSLESKAQEELTRDRKANTERRARFAASALNAAEAQKALAKTMRNIAAAIEAGKAKFLDAVRTKTQVEMLTGYVRTAKDNELRSKYPAYADQEKRKGEPATAETADFAEFPTYSAYRSDFASLARRMLEVEGTKKLGQQLMSVADDMSDAYTAFAKENLLKVSAFTTNAGLADFASKEQAERSIKASGLTGKAIVLQVKRGQNRIVLSPSEAITRGIWQGDDKRITLTPAYGAELVQAIGRRGNKANKLEVPWQLQTAHDRREALKRIGIETPSEFRSALREFIGLQELAARNKVREMELAMVGKKNDGLDFFPTPEEVADQMVDAADIKPEMSVLEPSAGMGHIAERIQDAGVTPDVAEISSERRELLEEKGFDVVGWDFLDLKGEKQYDRIIMNPPFSNRRDAEHVRHAYTLLKPGGRIVAIMGEGVFFGQDKKAQEFRDWLDEVGGTSEKLPEGSFMDKSLPVNTGANARMVVIDKAGRAGVDGDAPALGRNDLSDTLKRAMEARQTGMRLADAKAAVDEVTAKWDGGPDVNVVASVYDLRSKANINAPEDARGVYFRGSVWLVAGNNQDRTQLLTTLAHEAVAHYGLREMLGADAWSVLMGNINTATENGNKAMQAIREDLRRIYVDDDGNYNLSKNKEADEIAARVVEMAVDPQTGEFRPGFGFVKSVYARIAQFLRDLGIDVKFTMAELQGMLVRAQGEIQNGKGRGPLVFSGGPLFQRTELSNGTLPTMPESKAPGPKGDAQQGANTGNAVIDSGIRFVAEIESLAEKHGRVYIRWSPGSDGDLSGDQQSRDFLAGTTHAGLSAIEITGDTHPVDIAKRLSEYGFLRMQDRRAAPRIYLADRVGTDSDGYASIKPKKLLLEADNAILRAIDSNLAKVMDVLDDIKRDTDRLVENPGHHAITERLSAAKVRLATLIPNEPTAPNENGAFSRQDQTQTPAFKAWFGDSVVTDNGKPMSEGGKPLVVYHGTRADIHTFAGDKVKSRFPNSEGFYFTSRPLHASVYADSIDNAAADFNPGNRFIKPVAEGGNVMPVYVSLQNPKIMGVSEWGTLESRVDGDGGAGVREARATGHDGVIVRRRAGDDYDGDLVIAFHPNQIKSATGNQGAFDPNNDDIRFARGGAGNTLPTTRTLSAKIMEAMNDTFNVPGKLHWWHKTVGTQYNLSKRSPQFKRVFDGVQAFLSDVSLYATEAADLAPRLLPKLETWRDIAKKPISPQDNKAVAAPIFGGTLLWTRDGDGKPVKVADREAEAATMTADDKARALLRAGNLDPKVLKMWQGHDVDRFEAMVSGAYERAMLQPGIVWTDQELKDRFNLNDGQIGLYKEFRKSVDRSLTQLAISDMLKFGGKDVQAVRQKALDAPDVDTAAAILRDHLLEAAGQQPTRNDVLTDTANRMIDKAARARDLMERGYAPLSRFGHYTLDVVAADGERVYFGLFESPREAARMARKMRGDFPDAKIKRGTVSEEEYKVFAGVSPETVELFGELLGLEAQGDGAAHKAFQEYLKVSKASRSAMKRLIERKGIDGFSEDVGRVLAGFVYSNARQTSQNLHFGEVTDAVNEVNKVDKVHGELKDAAVRLFEYVKNPHEEAQAFRGLLFAQYLGGSLASAMVNMLQPVQVTFPYLSQFGGAAKAAKRMKQAFADVKNGKTGDKELDDALKKAEEEGIVAPQEVHQLMAQSQGRGVLKPGDGTTAGDAAAKASNALSRLTLAWGKVFGVAEQMNRRVTFIAAYRTAVEQGMENPAAFAENAVNETQFIYNKGNKPQWARGAVGSVLFTFKQYSVSYVELLHRMATQNGPEGRKAALLALGMLFLMAGAGGMPFAEDVQDLVDGVMQRLGYNFNSKLAKRQFFERVLGKDFGRFVEHGLSGLPGMPLDVSGRLGLGNLIPGTGLFVDKADHTRDVVEFAGAAGDFATRLAKGVDQLTQGNTREAAKQVSPRAVANWAKAVEMWTTGQYKDDRGRKVIDVDGFDALVKAIGFQPTDVARVQEATGLQQRLIAGLKQAESRFAERWAQAVADGKTEELAQVRADIVAYNQRNPDTPVRINRSQIAKRVQAIRSGKAERVAKTAPKEIRGQVRQVLAEVE